MEKPYIKTCCEKVEMLSCLSGSNNRRNTEFVGDMKAAPAAMW